MTVQSPTLPGVLAGLLRERGAALLDDRRRLLGLLRDKIPAEVRAIRILMMAYDQGVASRLGSATVTGIEVGGEAAVLASETGLSLDVARQAVETWAVALGTYAPETAAPGEPPGPADGARLSVEKLPPRSAAAGMPGTAARPAAAAIAPATGTAATSIPASTRRWVQHWPALLLGVLVIIGGVSEIIHAIGGWSSAEPPTVPAGPPAEPSQPGTPPSTSQGPQPQKTPEGITAVSLIQPYPTVATERIKDKQKHDNPNTLGIYFGVPVGQDFVSYYAAFAFDPGQKEGKGIITVLRNKVKATTDVIDAARVVETDTGKNFLRVFGQLASNTTGAPDLCVFAEVSPNLDHVEPVSKGLFAVFALDGSGNCDLQTPLGFGRFK